MILRAIFVSFLGFVFAFVISCTSLRQSSTLTAEEQVTPILTHQLEVTAADEEANESEEDFPELTPPAISQGVVSSAYSWPVDEARLTRGFSAKPTGKRRRPHWGIDLAYNRGTPIFSAQKGRIIYAGKDFRGYGRFVLVENEDGWASLYAHLSKIRVKMGQWVEKGDRLGDMGRTGRATGVHLHFEIRKDRTPVDPLEYLPQSHVAYSPTNTIRR